MDASSDHYDDQQQLLQQQSREEPQTQTPPEQSQEQVYTSMARIFEIEPKIKRTWTPKSDQAVPVSLVLDLRQRILRLIGTHQEQHNKTIINSIILPKTVFTLTSQKFGQWTDSVANTIYGLGFASEIELNKFVNKFQDFKKLLPNVTPSSSSSVLTNYNNSSGTHQNQAHSHLTSSPSSCMNVDGPTSVNSMTSNNDLNHNSNDLNNTQSHNILSHATNQHRQQLEQRLATSTNNIAPDSNGNSMISEADLEGADNIAANSMGIHQRTQSLSGIQAKMNSSNLSTTTNDQQHHYSVGQNAKLSSNSTLAGAGVNSINNPATINNHAPLSPRETQLKYENDRLRLALAKNSDNAKEWAVVVHKLQANIVKLTGALQASSANRKEWQQQLSTLKSENDKYQLRILELEAANGDPEARIMFQERLDRLDYELEEKQNTLKKKDFEMEILRKKLDELQLEMNSSKINNGNMEAHDTTKQLEGVFTKFGFKVRELVQLHLEFGSLLELQK